MCVCVVDFCHFRGGFLQRSGSSLTTAESDFAADFIPFFEGNFENFPYRGEGSETLSRIGAIGQCLITCATLRTISSSDRWIPAGVMEDKREVNVYQNT